MPWTADPAASFGFSSGVPAAEPWLPPPAGWGKWAVDAESADPSSMLALYREVLALRRTLPHDEPVEWVLPDRDDLVAFRVGSLLVALNMSASSIELPGELIDGATRVAASVAFDGAVGTVPADSCVWLHTAAR
jgi:alpha-glucosidase